MMEKKKKVLLVGAGGLTGNAFRTLYADKYDIISITRSNINNLSAVPAGELEAIVYLAQSADYKSPLFTADLMEVNVRLLHQALLVGADQTKKFIYFSTGSVYDFSNTGDVDESGAINWLSGNPYITSKLMGEELVHTFVKKFAQTYILRPFFIYGREQKASMLFSVMRQKLQAGQSIELASGKGLVFNPIFVNDAAAAIDTLITDTGNGPITTLNLFGPEETTLDEVVNQLATQLSLKPELVAANAPEKRMMAKTLSHYSFGVTSIQEGILNFLKGE